MISPRIVDKLISKAEQACSTYKISAMAFNRKGELLGSATNGFRTEHLTPARGTGSHAERKLMARYGDNIKTIIICRIGKTGDLLPINPCAVCQKIADKMGIKIISVKGDA